MCGEREEETHRLLQINRRSLIFKLEGSLGWLSASFSFRVSYVTSRDRWSLCSITCQGWGTSRSAMVPWYHLRASNDKMAQYILVSPGPLVVPPTETRSPFCNLALCGYWVPSDTQATSTPRFWWPKPVGNLAAQCYALARVLSHRNPLE